MSKLITYHEQGDIGYITLSRPEKRNALNSEMVEEFQRILPTKNIPTWIILSGEDCFCAGADLSEWVALSFDPKKLQEITQRARSLFQQLYDHPSKLIAAIEQLALGGGAELAYTCDYRIAGEHAKIGQPEVTLGFSPGAYATRFLPEKIGFQRTAELVLTGNQISARNSFEWGLIDAVVEDGQALVAAEEFTRSPKITPPQDSCSRDESIELQWDPNGIVPEYTYQAALCALRDPSREYPLFLETLLNEETKRRITERFGKWTGIKNSSN